tara:strand:+ start:6652 stop:7149 length:498 start_codon:yes stop_codon:yes gene_type:complete
MANPYDSFAPGRFTQPLPSLGKVGQYQMSGIPFITGSVFVHKGGSDPLEVAFPQVTRFVTVVNEATGSNKPLRVGFSSNGVTGSHPTREGAAENYFVLNNGESYTGEWRVAAVYLLGANKPLEAESAANVTFPTTASVIAGLTGIPSQQLVRATNSNWSGSAGVG